MGIASLSRMRVAFLLVTATALAGSSASFAQSTAPSHVVIPFLANDTKPTDLEFEGAECDRNAAGDQMTCVFQQVFLTTTPIAPDTCLVTTNQYQRTFRRDSPTHWTSREGPNGLCGLVDVATLQDDGRVRWTMELKTEVTRPDAAPACRSVDGSATVFGWRNIRRPLPCKFVQPGGLSR